MTKIRIPSFWKRGASGQTASAPQPLKTLIVSAMFALLACTATANVSKSDSRFTQYKSSPSAENNKPLPIWADDDSALYIQKTNQIIKIDTASGTESPMIDFEKVKKITGFNSPHLERFALIPLYNNGGGDRPDDWVDFLISDGDQCATLTIDGNEIRTGDRGSFSLAQYDNPSELRSSSTGTESVTFFINNTDEPVQLFRISSDGAKHPEAVVQPNTSCRQNTYYGQVWIAGDLGFIAERGTSTAYLAKLRPEILAANSVHIDARDITLDELVTGHRYSAFVLGDQYLGILNSNLGPKAEISCCNHNLFINNSDTGETTQLTFDGTEEQPYGPSYLSSPDKRYVIALQREIMPLRSDNTHAPQMRPIDLALFHKPRLFDINTLKQIPIDGAPLPDFWQLTYAHWAPDSSQFFFAYNAPDEQKCGLAALNPQTGSVNVLTEKEQADRSAPFILMMDQTSEAIWMSQHSGQNHLYLIHLKSGKTTPITTGEFSVRHIKRVDRDAREIFFAATGIYSDQNPENVHYARVGFDGSNLTHLTESDGSHALFFSPKNTYYLDRWRDADQSLIYELRRTADGGLITSGTGFESIE
ncbi:MAG: DPP IV N-terminal domain-containing protein [Pontiellaceae bacterium]|nr:DPP IV N-terminal domain-containing protein [Pontiellaceae bacterium]